MTKEEFLNGTPFVIYQWAIDKEFTTFFNYEKSTLNDGSGYIRENFGKDVVIGHHYNVKKVTDMNVHVYTTVVCNSVNTIIPLARLFKREIPAPSEPAI